MGYTWCMTVARVTITVLMTSYDGDNSATDSQPFGPFSGDQIDVAVKRIALMKWSLSGQICVAPDAWR